MNIVDLMLKESNDIWKSYYEHPFIKEMNKGELDIKKFKFYLIQDYYYLFEYTKIFAIGITKTNDEKLMQGLAKIIDSILNDELNLHRNYMKRLGITKEDLKNTKISLFNKSYTNYMMAESLNGDILDVLASIFSCAYSYHLIAKNMLTRDAKVLGHSVYGEWVEAYTDPEYESLNLWLIEIINKLSENITIEKKNRMIDIFVTCSRYEWYFWEGSYLMTEN